MRNTTVHVERRLIAYYVMLFLTSFTQHSKRDFLLVGLNRGTMSFHLASGVFYSAPHETIYYVEHVKERLSTLRSTCVGLQTAIRYRAGVYQRLQVRRYRSCLLGSKQDKTRS